MVGSKASNCFLTIARGHTVLEQSNMKERIAKTLGPLRIALPRILSPVGAHFAFSLMIQPRVNMIQLFLETKLAVKKFLLIHLDFSAACSAEGRMRVLLVDAYPTASKNGRDRFASFRRHVLCAIQDIQRSEVTNIEIIERHRSALDEFLYELKTEFADPHAITRFDQLDFVLIDGDGSTSPWAPSARKLALLAKMCMMTGKCLFAAGLGASLLAYVCATGGELLRVINNGGKGGVLDAINNLPPPSPMDLQNEAVYLDIKSGDFFTYTARDNNWTPKGNTGIVLHSSDDSRTFYGARPNSARAGGISKSGSAHLSLRLERRGEERCCARLEALRDHAILRAAFSPSGNTVSTHNNREVVLRCTSRWDIDEEISCTGGNKFRVLMDSARGPMLLEFGNCLGSHFELDARAYPSTLELLRQFLCLKYEELKVHAHLDRSYVTAISGGNIRLRERLVMAQNKRVARPLSAGATQSTSSRSSKDNGVTVISATQFDECGSANAPGMSPGRTSPKRCRPLSAGPQRSITKVAAPNRTVQTSRPVYLNRSIASVSGSTSVPVMAISRTSDNNRIVDGPPGFADTGRTRDEKRREGWNEPETCPETEEPAVGTSADQKNASSSSEEDKPKIRPRIIRVPQKNELEKPYCAFSKRRGEDQQHQAAGSDYYSVVNDAPYISTYEREILEQQKSKLRWVAGPFRAVVGKASTQVVPEVGLFTRTPFVQKNMPHYIIQRRTLEEESVQPTKSSRQRTKSRPQRSPPNNRKWL